MVKRNYKGGNKIPLPQVSTYPENVGNARGGAIARQNHDSEYLNQLNNHTHGDGSQIGGAQCTGGAIPLPPTYGVPQGPGHMSPHNQTGTNYNNACQGIANRQFDSLVPKPSPPQLGGKRKSKTTKRRHKKRHNKTMKRRHKKSIKRRRNSNRRHKKSIKRYHKK